MDELLNQFNLNIQENFSISIFLINIVTASVLLYILSRLYIKFGNSMSNRDQLSRVLIIIGVTTFLIITIVKSSLALSLGLVGALSIVRFRTAIKEPEELGFFFIAIAIGLGLGANQLIPTLVGFIVLAIIIIFLNRNKMKGTLTQNIIISLSSNEKDNNTIVDMVSSVLKNNSNQLEIKRLNSTEDNLSLNFLINVTDLNALQTISKELSDIDKKMNVTFIDSII
ncbi:MULTISPECIES: DUF4956 domain-containing protein [Aquimarina]|uniref:DUF4956 domain-containing protein n=1 Tax=Aquimarina TaxID=290174 RepID=UPI000944C5A1|nr:MULTISPECIES: DUF4956 domain-containing protein [Aquimarina]